MNQFLKIIGIIILCVLGLYIFGAIVDNVVAPILRLITSLLMFGITYILPAVIVIVLIIAFFQWATGKK